MPEEQCNLPRWLGRCTIDLTCRWWTLLLLVDDREKSNPPAFTPPSLSKSCPRFNSTAATRKRQGKKKMHFVLIFFSACIIWLQNFCGGGGGDKIVTVIVVVHQSFNSPMKRVMNHNLPLKVWTLCGPKNWNFGSIMHWSIRDYLAELWGTPPTVRFERQRSGWKFDPWWLWESTESSSWS